MIDKEYIDKRTAKLSEIETCLSDPDVTANQKLFQQLLREHSSLRKLSEKAKVFFSLQNDVEEHRELIDGDIDDQEIKELASNEINDLEKKLSIAEENLMVVLLPPDPNDSRNAIIEIRAGTGGNEAALFAGDLFRLYNHFADGRGWKIKIIDISTCEVGGYKEIMFSVEGDGAYGSLQYESGVHRVQRVPITESSGRIHTSAATVAVFPEVEEDDDLNLDPDEIRVDIYCASGPGGQCVNTTYSAVRITHLPTGLVAQSQDERSQHRNKDRAMSVLKARILDLRRRQDQEKKGSLRRSLIGSGDRSERIRTYNFPQNRLTDHRINFVMYSLDRIMDGNINELLTALRAHDVKLRIEEELSVKKK